MPDAQEARLTAADIRRLLNEKFPPTNDRENVYVATVLTLLEEIEAQGQMIRGLTVTLNKVARAAGIDLKALLKGEASAASTPAADAPAGPTDQTPFPAGVAASGPPNSPPRVSPKEPVEEDLAPNTQSQPPTNVRPNISGTNANGQPRS